MSCSSQYRCSPEASPYAQRRPVEDRRRDRRKARPSGPRAAPPRRLGRRGRDPRQTRLPARPTRRIRPGGSCRALGPPSMSQLKPASAPQPAEVSRAAWPAHRPGHAVGLPCLPTLPRASPVFPQMAAPSARGRAGRHAAAQPQYARSGGRITNDTFVSCGRRDPPGNLVPGPGAGIRPARAAAVRGPGGQCAERTNS